MTFDEIFNTENKGAFSCHVLEQPFTLNDFAQILDSAMKKMMYLTKS